MTMFDTVKPIALAVFIAIAFGLRCLPATAAGTETLTVAGGCFWCVESDFESLPGVVDAESGFTGGTVENPTYKQVTGGNTGHYEAVQITFDPGVVSRERLLTLFIRSVDPTDPGGQFCDRGDIYRTAVFVADAGERALAERVIARAQADLSQPIVTPVLPAAVFYPADAYHQDFYKSDKVILTRFGPRRQSEAYKRYRQACGRDQRVRELWGSAAFTGS